ncbi:MAG: flagellar basal body-associated FliL family protein [Wenzhouxiangellaceae bacterium]|nr:flagellar basal body-associated FliL family protein [Wenzhouxiangellaceae bacterium]
MAELDQLDPALDPELDPEFDPELAGDGKPSGGGRKRLIVILTLVLLLLGGGGAAAWYFLMPSEPVDPEVARLSKPALYLALNESFIVNLSDSGRLMQVGVEVMAREQAALDAVSRHMPAVRNNLLMLFSSQGVQEISSAAGKETMREQALAEVRGVVRNQGEEALIEDLFFTALVVQ